LQETKGSGLKYDGEEVASITNDLTVESLEKGLLMINKFLLEENGDINCFREKLDSLKGSHAEKTMRQMERGENVIGSNPISCSNFLFENI
jgi:hypothetical protein